MPDTTTPTVSPSPSTPSPVSDPPSGTTPNSPESDKKAFYDYFQEHKTQGNEAAYRDSLKTLASQGNRYAAQRLRDLQGKDLGFNASEARDHEQLAALHERMADDTTTWALASASLLTGAWATGAVASGTVVAAGGATATAGGATAVGGTAALGTTGGTAVTSGLAATATGGATSVLATTGGASTAALATTGTAASASDLMVARTLQQLVNLRATGDMAGPPFLMPALRLTGAAGIRSLLL